MKKYNASRTGTAGLILSVVLMAGCATTSDNEVKQGVLTPIPEADASPAASRDSGMPDNRRAQRLPPREGDVELRDDAPLRYVVKKGDTLWDISQQFLKRAWYWPELWYVNPDIPNPHLIYPGDVLHLVYTDGRPQLRRVSGSARLSPRVRTLPVDEAISTIPLDAIRQFLNGPRLVTEEQLQQAPYVVQFVDDHLVGGAGNQTYVRRAEQANGDNYALVRPGEEYVDPDSGDVLGIEALPIGAVEIQEFRDISTAIITRSFREALIGDRLLPLEDEALAANFYPRAPDVPVDATIISVYGGVSQIGQYQIVALNRGGQQGLERGHVLDVFQSGRAARDPVTGEKLILPPLKAGTLIVFKVEDRIAYGLVMRATRAIHVLDGAGNPE